MYEALLEPQSRLIKGAVVCTVCGATLEPDDDVYYLPEAMCTECAYAWLEEHRRMVEYGY